MSWSTEMPVLAEAAAELPGAIAAARAALDPMPVRDLMVVMVQTLRVWKLPEDWSEVAAFYREALEDVPADLVPVALKHCRLTLKWFPKPAELREPIQLELRRRRGVLQRLETMQQRLDRDGVGPRPPLRLAAVQPAGGGDAHSPGA